MIKRQIEASDAGKLIREYVYENLHLSQRHVKAIKELPNGITVNGEERTVRYELKAGDQLIILFPTEKTNMTAEDLALDIIYEDDWLLVINKPAGMPTIPSQLHPSGTLANGLLFYYQKKELPYTVHIVTRLDKDTSGLVLIAKHRHAHHLLSKQLQAGKISRTYEAIVHGHLANEGATIDAAIGRKNDSIIEREVRADGQAAISHYQVIERLPNHLTHVRVKLETGRTHQIRVHFAHIGHPLLGDDLYGGSAKLLPRQALHAHTILCYHPLEEKLLQWSVGLPPDLRAVVDQGSSSE